MNMANERKTKSIIDNKYFDLVKELLRIYETTYKLYQELAKLEKNGLKDTDEYNMIYELIPHCIENELKTVKKFDNMISDELQELKDQITYLLETNESELTDKTDFYVSNKYKRLLSRLRDYAFLRNDTYDIVENEEIEEENPEYELSSYAKVQVSFQGKTANVPMNVLQNLIDKYSGNKKHEPTEEEIKEEKEYDKIVNNAWYQRYAIVDINFYKKLEEEINKTTDKTIRNILIDFKYNLIYSSVALENRFVKEKDSTKWISLKHVIDLLAEEYPEEYEDNYSASIEYEIKYKLSALMKKTFDPKDKLDILDNKIDMMYIKSLIGSLITKNSLDNINETLNVANNENVDVEMKENILELKNTTKELKLKK